MHIAMRCTAQRHYTEGNKKKTGRTSHTFATAMLRFSLKAKKQNMGNCWPEQTGGKTQKRRTSKWGKRSRLDMDEQESMQRFTKIQTHNAQYHPEIQSPRKKNPFIYGVFSEGKARTNYRMHGIFRVIPRVIKWRVQKQSLQWQKLLNNTVEKNCITFWNKVKEPT